MTNLLDIGVRLKEERKRLGMSQTAFAAIGGTKRASQFNYESGGRAPDAAYLAAISETGVDVLYVLTGQRVSMPRHVLGVAQTQQTYQNSSNVPSQVTAEPHETEVFGVARNRREAALLDNFRHSNDEGRDVISAAGNALAKLGKKD
ncbi:helix-turn-helix domain-containing protein [Solimicrobium silvestre]|uniref:Helix-turn-helix domain n=1 Tax=Solimicrobium silvestre TaxID=2099400 RepID=A0A2S9GW49_9BURK|nr:helix-turn-helix transcriptional regulator [Solimicrobium silvestre]PRC91949.1 Helix-turn-helix domain [Solimicrobium silvestre]